MSNRCPTCGSIIGCFGPFVPLSEAHPAPSSDEEVRASSVVAEVAAMDCASRADAEYFTDRAAPVGNEEMTHLATIRRIKASLSDAGIEK